MRCYFKGKQVKVNISLLQFAFSREEEDVWSWSHVCCLRNYKYTPRHFQVKGWVKANAQTRLARERVREGGLTNQIKSIQPNNSVIKMYRGSV